MIWWATQGTTWKDSASLGKLWAPRLDVNGNKRPYWESLAEVQVGDLVVNYGGGAIRGWGEVTEPPRSDSSPFQPGAWNEEGRLIAMHVHLLDRPVVWTEVPADIRRSEGRYLWPFDKQGRPNVGYLFKAEAALEEWLRAKVVAASATVTDNAPDRRAFPDAGGQLEEATFFPRDWLQDTLDLIERRKQVILYGPPGTGKTFLAQALSKHVTDGTDGETTIVQFHPTYSYEDFFEGFRPVANDESGNLAFSLRRGPLRRLADSAAANPEANYFLVIDEINRGNIAKVFGELYFLLEYRDSEISLLYSDEPFTLPSNIFVIGTMNTADRSIAMLDAAMRRRFAFIELHPERDPVRDVLAGWVATKGLQDDRAGLLTRLNAAIADHDAKVGPSFLMRDLDADGLADAWRYEILPLLAEHHYGDGVDLEARYGLAALRRQATPSVADGTEGADTAG